MATSFRVVRLDRIHRSGNPIASPRTAAARANRQRARPCGFVGVADVAWNEGWALPRRRLPWQSRDRFMAYLAERQGFEPWEPVRVHLISSQADSTALAPLRRALSVTAEQRASVRLRVDA